MNHGFLTPNLRYIDIRFSINFRLISLNSSYTENKDFSLPALSILRGGERSRFCSKPQELIVETRPESNEVFSVAFF